MHVLRYNRQRHKAAATHKTTTQGAPPNVVVKSQAPIPKSPNPSAPLTVTRISAPRCAAVGMVRHPPTPSFWSPRSERSGPPFTKESPSRRIRRHTRGARVPATAARASHGSRAHRARKLQKRATAKPALTPSLHGMALTTATAAHPFQRHSDIT